VDGVSLVNNYRGQFSKILRNGSYADLVEQLRKKSEKDQIPVTSREPIAHDDPARHRRLSCMPARRDDPVVGAPGYGRHPGLPIPSASSSKNDGSDAGLIVPILITDPDGELKYLMAPMLIKNTLVGTRGTFNLFRYEPGGRQMQFIASLSGKDRTQTALQLC
jgi:hypothetical protein